MSSREDRTGANAESLDWGTVLQRAVAGKESAAGAIVAIREGYDRNSTALWPEPPDPWQVADVLLSATPRVRARMYFATPPAPGHPSPAVVFFHGGAWCYGSLDSHDALCRSLAVKSGATVISVDYRLAPEHTFPAAVEDGVMSLKWVRQHSSEYGIDPNRIAVAGDSAGGNIAMAVSLKLRDQGEHIPRFQLLLYPCLSMALDSDSWRRLGQGPGLEINTLRWAIEQYAPGPVALDPYASPRGADDLTGLAPTYLQVGDQDPLLDDSVQMAEQLIAQGSPAQVDVYAGRGHGFMRYGLVDGTEDAIGDAARELRARL